ncbi:MAG TPA: ABC transporter ATP-binding protein, partial [bacterium]|nr:ABC transporter ATP-binding protein [bacterium]
MSSPAPRQPLAARLKAAVAVFREVPPTFRLLWASDAKGAAALALLMTVGAAIPVGIAWTGKLLVDAVVLASKSGLAEDRRRALVWVGVELALFTLQTAEVRVMTYLREAIGARLGFDINVRILEKALTLELRHFEDSDVYDKMQNARREASSRPLSLVMEAFSIGQNFLTLAAYAALLVRISPLSVLVLVVASIPAFVVTTRLSGESYRINSWRAPEGRKLNYLEWILTRDAHVKEVKLFDLGPLFLDRYKTLYQKFWNEDRALARKRAVWGMALGLLSLAAFYGCYALIVSRAAAALITLGDMTLYVAVFREGQGSFQAILAAVGSMYEDALFMSNLFLYL